MRQSTLRNFLRRRGSVLILVVALLVLLALVGTAYLTTTRFDRSAAVANVVNTQKDFSIQSAINIVQANVLDDILDPQAINRGESTTVRPPSNVVNQLSYLPIDSPLADFFLAERLPHLQWTLPLNGVGGAGAAIPRPMWRTVSWPQMSASSAWSIETPDANFRVQPATAQIYTPKTGQLDLVRTFTIGDIYKTGEVVAVPGEAAGLFNYYIRNRQAPFTATTVATAPPNSNFWEKCDPKQYFTYAPTTVEISGVVYPAFYVFNNYVAPDWNAAYNPATANYAPYVTGPILAGDADGDGIADSVYSKIPLGQINGLTYYLAMRIVDNNSAINLNTAWSNQNDFGFDPTTPADPAWRAGTLPVYGFFPTNVGLRELFFSFNRPNLIGEPSQVYGTPAPASGYNTLADNDLNRLLEVTRHNLYRFGFPDSTAASALGLTPASNDVAGTTTFGNLGAWSFRTQGEALTAQLIRRPENPGVADTASPYTAINNLDTRTRWISLPTDGASLAYRGGTLVNIDTPPSGVERRFAASVGSNGALDPYGTGNGMDSLYSSAINQRDPSDNVGSLAMYGKRTYPTISSSTVAAVAGTNAIVDRWFDVNFNFDRRIEPGRLTADSSANPFYRSIRPLVVTSNPVSNVIGPRAGVSGAPSVPSEVADIGTNNVINPDYSLTIGFGGRGYALILDNTPTNFGGPMDLGNGTLEAIVGSFSAMRQYRNPGSSQTQSLPISTIPKVSANTAEFGDLWRAYWNVMAENWGEVAAPAAGVFTLANSGTPFEAEITAYQAAVGADVLRNPYWGSRWGHPNRVNNYTLADLNNIFPATTRTSTGPNGALIGTVNQVPVMPRLPNTPTDPPLEYNPARMFRSPIRSFVLDRVAQTASNFGTALPALPAHMRPDQVALLRSALAAVNAEDLRDTDFKTTRRTIRLNLTTAAGQQAVAVTINGYEPQPFITEVYVSTDTAGVRVAGALTPPANDGLFGRSTGYVAIELHNPYPFPIDIRNCKIACINRFNPDQNGYPEMFVEDMELRNVTGTNPITTPVIDLRSTTNVVQTNLDALAYMPPTVIPANGYLVLENYNAAAGTGHRPAAARLQGLTVGATGQGQIQSAISGPRANFAYVPNLHLVMNREFVLLRPVDVVDPTVGNNGFVPQTIAGVLTPTLTYADPVGIDRPRAADMVPLDSYDFTGLLPSTFHAGTFLDPAVPTFGYTLANARAWHYVRANESQTVANLNGEGAWKFVYPGRYDAARYVYPLAGPDLRQTAARQQGTRDSGFWDDGEDTDPTAPTEPTNPTNPTDPNDPTPHPPGLRAPPVRTTGDPWEYNVGVIPISLGRPDSVASYRHNYANFNRGEFAIPLAFRGAIPFGIDIGLAPRFFPAQIAGAGSEIQPAHFPFGGFARNGDLLEVPFIGSYKIQRAEFVGSTLPHDPYVSTAPNTPTEVGVQGDVVFELNPITMDAAMAEDTDVLDDPIVGNPQPDIGFQSREQIGRFVPLRKTWLPTQAGGNDVSTVGATNLNEPPDYNGRTFATTAAEPNAVLYDDTTPNIEGDPAAGAAYTRTSLNRYRWAADLFDYLTVQSPSQDYQPNSVPAIVKADNFAIDPTAVHNTLRNTANDAGETNLPFEGLVNINTASERVLAMLPWVPDLIGNNDLFRFTLNAAGYFDVAFVPAGDGVADNLQIARAIVQFRQGFEARNDTIYLPGPAQFNFRSQPFLSVWDLYRVPELREIQKLLLDPQPNNDPTTTRRLFLDDRVGDISPYPYEFGSVNFNTKFFGVGEILQSGGVRYQCITSHVSTNANPAGDAVNWRATNNLTPLGPSRAMFDYEEQSLLLNRVSNLITTRSDMFTAYVLIEGWENAGTDKAALRVSKRAAFFLDRSQTTPGKIELKAPIPIPTE